MNEKFLDEASAKKTIISVGSRMYSLGYVAANDGNISIKTSENEIWATPTGVSKGFMTEDMLVKLDLDGQVLEGSLKPSSEIKMHLSLYRENPKIGAVVHAHPPFSCVYAAAAQPLDKALIQETIVLLGTVPVAPYAPPGSAALADSVAPFAKTHGAVLLEHHGLTAWGKDLNQAMFRLESAENYARTSFYTKLAGFDHLLTESQIDELIALRPSWGIALETGGRPKGRPDEK